MRIKELRSKGEKLVESHDSLEQRIYGLEEERDQIVWELNNLTNQLSEFSSKMQDGDSVSQYDSTRKKIEILRRQYDQVLGEMDDLKRELEDVKKEEKDTISEISDLNEKKYDNVKKLLELQATMIDPIARNLVNQIILEMNNAEQLKDRLIDKAGGTGGGVRYQAGFSSASGQGTPVSARGNSWCDNPESNEQKVVGISVKSELDPDYVSVLEHRYENADPKVRNVYDRFSGQIRIQDTEWSSEKGPPHYVPFNSSGEARGVYYNAKSDLWDLRGSGKTFYHEIAHMIDHAITGFQGNMSDTEEFYNALISDGLDVTDMYYSLTESDKEDFLKIISHPKAHSFSDLIDAITDGQISGGYTHPREYWKNDGNLQSEAFAHFFEASMGDQSKMRFLSQQFPRATACFANMIDSLQSGVNRKAHDFVPDIEPEIDLGRSI